jgi:excisionase family DNA binding protein
LVVTRLLTVAEAAEALHVSKTTVRALCKARKLRHERHGLGRGTIRIPVEAIEEYRASVTVPVKEESLKPPQPALRKLRYLSLD